MITVSTSLPPEEYVYPIVLDMQIAMREHALSVDEALALSDELRQAALAIRKPEPDPTTNHRPWTSKEGTTVCYICGHIWPCASSENTLG